MNVDEVMQIIKDAFDEEISASISGLCGYTYPDIEGKEDFLNAVKTKLMEIKKQEDSDLASVGIISGEDAQRFLDRMAKVDEEYEKRKNK